MIFKKEKEVVDLVVKHVANVEECLRLAVVAIETYVRGDVKEAKVLARQVDAVESAADQVRHEIRDKLFSGAYMPLLREDIYKLVQLIDGLADGAEVASDFFLNQRPVVPPEFRSCFEKIIQLSFSSIGPLKESLYCFFKGDCDVEVVHSFTHEISLIESRVDKMKWDMTKKIFISSLEYSHKLHLKMGVDCLAAVSDLAKTTADQIEISTMKSMF